VQYDHTDGLGSPVALTDAAGKLISRTRYEPYGATAAGATPGIGFTGHVNAPELGLVYMQQRYYDPGAGRFLSIDPVVTDSNTGNSFNRYAYAANSPYKYIDPDGRTAITAEVCLGFCAGITIGYNVASTEIAIVGNVGAGLGGGFGLDARPNENGRAGSSPESRASGVSGNTYSKGGVDIKTPLGSVGLAGKVVAGKDLGTGKTFGGLSPEIGVSKERGAKFSIVAAGGVEGAAYMNVRDAANDIKTAISAAASDFNKNVVQPALKALEPQIDKATN
jgi:RHS repeat-associated protein